MHIKIFHTRNDKIFKEGRDGQTKNEWTEKE